MAPADRLSRVLLAGAVCAGLAACGGTSSGSAGPNADVTFATNMIPHHAQGVAVAQLAATHASSSRIKQLATQISAEQVPEIAQMQSMLAGWGAPPASTSMAGMAGMASMPGMLTDGQMAQLGAASGPAFDRLFLQMMIVHDQGGITMARTEMTDGRDPDATTLAQNIDDAQEYAVPVLQQLLASGP